MNLKTAKTEIFYEVVTMCHSYHGQFFGID